MRKSKKTCIFTQFNTYRNMKRKFLTIAFAFFVFAIPVLSIVNGQPLTDVLRDLRSELKMVLDQSGEDQQLFDKEYDIQHQKLVDVITTSNELSILLYTQEQRMTFDLAYALNKVTNAYKDFSKDRRPYDHIVKEQEVEIDRYARLIEALRRLPPVMTEIEVEILPDSLMYHNDSLGLMISELDSSLEKEVIRIAIKDSLSSPFVLDAEGEIHRDSCILYASELLKRYAANRNLVLADSLHYQAAYWRIEEAYNYAQSRYRDLEKYVFMDGQTPFMEIMANPGAAWEKVKAALHSQYDFDELDNDEEQSADSNEDSDIFNGLSSKGANSTLVLVSIIQLVALILFWLLTFFLLWLLLAITGSLLLRVNPKQIHNSLRLYIHTILIALIIIVCRINFVPDLLMNFLFPPILAFAVLRQLFFCIRENGKATTIDSAMGWASLAIYLIAFVAAFLGYSFVALLVLIWWYFQLAVILTILCISDLMGRYKERWLDKQVDAAREKITYVSGADRESLLFGATWFYDLIKQVLIPAMVLLSVPFCIHLSLDVFDFDALFHKMFENPFVLILDKEGFESLRISVKSIIGLAILFFVLRYFNRAVHAIWQYSRYAAFMRKHNRTSIQDNEINLSLGNSIISVLIWMIYIIVVVDVWKIPTGSLGLVAGGLSAGIGLALKDIINNFIYGIQLMGGRLRVGDWIECDGVRGRVVAINYQCVVVETLEGTEMSFLNESLFGKNFNNLTRNNSYEFTKIITSVAYGTDVKKVRKALVEAMDKLRTKDKYGREIVEPVYGINVVVNDMADSGVEIAVKQYVLVPERISYIDSAKEVIYDALNGAGITIPFPQCDVHLVTDDKVNK